MHVFISYSRRDGEFHAGQLDHDLTVAGHSTWRDTRDIDVTQDFGTEIEHAICGCDVVIVCVTPDILRPHSFVRREIRFAQLTRRPIVVARFSDTIPPIDVATNTFIDFFTDPTAGLRTLLRALHGSTEKAPGPTDSHRSRYLAQLHQEVVDRLDELLLIPIADRKLPLLETLGELSWPASPAILPASRFHPVKPLAGVNTRRALRHARRRLAVVGAAGTGKTTALMVLARDLAVEAALDPAAPVPVLLPADSWTGGDLTTWVREEVPLLPSSERLILLVDGLDEVPEHVRTDEGELHTPRADLVDALRAVDELVITSRPEAITPDLETGRMLSLRQLTDVQVDEFLAHVPNVSKELRRDAELRAFVRTPLMLTLLCAAVEITVHERVAHLTAPEARDLIVGNFVESRYLREAAACPAPPSLESLYRALGELAMLDTGGGGNRNAFSEARVRRRLGDASEVLAVRMNLLVRARHNTFRFYHPAVRDHFAFREALTALHDPDPIVRDNAAWTLWRLPDRRALDPLLAAARDPDPYVRGSAAGALGRIGDHRAVPALQALLRDHTPVESTYGDDIAEVAKWALAELGIERHADQSED